MVDFNSEGMLGANKAHILTLIILNRRDDWVNAYQKFCESKYNNTASKNQHFNKMRSIADSIVLELQETINRRMKADDFHKDTLMKHLKSDKEEDAIEAFAMINKLFDTLNITKIDTHKKVDTTIIENENEAKGL